MPRTLTVSADLSLRTEGGSLHITGEGRRLDIDLSSLGAGAAVMRGGPFLGSPVRRLAGLHHALQGAGLTADVRLRGVPLARLGVGTRSGAFSRLLGLGDIEVFPAKPLSASLRRRPGITAAVAGIAGLAVLSLFFLRRRK